MCDTPLLRDSQLYVIERRRVQRPSDVARDDDADLLIIDRHGGRGTSDRCPIAAIGRDVAVTTSSTRVSFNQTGTGHG
jgi:hypothetical protein